MRAVLMEQIAGPLTVREAPEPVAPDGGVVVQVRATGLCRSDWHAWAGHDDIALPHVPGHELAGVVTAIGAGVRNWRIGDRVTVPFVEGCGHCEWCMAGNAQVCPDQQQPGFTHWGSFAEYVALHAADTNLVALPDDVSFAAAASLGCRFATAYRALVGRARLQAGEWVTVVGAGGVGLSAVLIAKALGAQVIAVDRHEGALAKATACGADHVLVAGGGPVHPPVPLGRGGAGGVGLSAVLIGKALGAQVVAVDRHEGALAKATACGADHVLVAGGGDIPAQVHQVTGGSHVAIDAVGTEQACADSILSLRRRGRHVQVGLLPPVHPPVPMARVIAWELDLLGSHGMAAADYPEMLALIASGALAPQDLVERVVGLDQAAQLLPAMETATPAGMTIVDPTSAE